MTETIVQDPMDVHTFAVHPAADVFPRLNEAELQELADDIAENGLRQPLVVQCIEGVWTLIDGRNRLAACAVAGVVPDVAVLDETIDPVAYIWSTNGSRRHLTAGQRAMSYALLYPEPARGKRNDLFPQETSSTVSRASISRARAILANPDLVSQVMANTMSLNDAHKQATERRMVSENRQQTINELRASAPDLADLVDEQRMTLEEAMAAARERQRVERANRFGVQKVLREFLDMVNVVTAHPQRVAEMHAGYADEFAHEVGMSPQEVAARLSKLDFSALAQALKGIR